jgi:hypothetical protein
MGEHREKTDVKWSNGWRLDLTISGLSPNGLGLSGIHGTFSGDAE